MKLFNNWNFKKHFSISLVLSLCMGTVGDFLIDKILLNKEIIRKTAEDSIGYYPTVHTSVIVHVFGSPLEIIISIGILLLIILLLLYKPVKWGISKLKK